MDSAEYSSDRASTLSTDFKQVASGNFRNFFKAGKVFRTPWVEPADAAHNSDKDRNIIRGRFNELLAEKIQWFIVFNSLPGHCHCVRVTTHNSRATTKPGVDPSHYCVLTPRGVVPKLLNDEYIPNPPIHVKLLKRTQEVAAAARIDLSRIYTVEYSVAVDAIGTIVPDDLRIIKSLVNRIALKNGTGDVPSPEHAAITAIEADRDTIRIDTHGINDGGHEASPPNQPIAATAHSIFSTEPESGSLEDGGSSKIQTRHTPIARNMKDMIKYLEMSPDSVSELALVGPSLDALRSLVRSCRDISTVWKDAETSDSGAQRP